MAREKTTTFFSRNLVRNEEIATTLEDQLYEETMKRLRNKWYDY